MSVGAGPAGGFQASLSILTLGTLYESILGFARAPDLASLYPAVCHNARWTFPFKRMCVLASDVPGGRDLQLACAFELGKSVALERAALDARARTALHSRHPKWIDAPAEALAGCGALADWLVSDRPATLLTLPICSEAEALGSLVLALGEVAPSDRAMLSALGTVYALHVGMAIRLLDAIEVRKAREAELDEKNRALADTLRRLRETQTQLLIQAKLASLGSLVAGIAHDLNNPVAAMNGAAEAAGRCLERIGQALDQTERDPVLDRSLRLLSESHDTILTAGGRVADVVRKLRSFARLDEAELKPADVHECIETTLGLVQHQLTDRIRVVRDYGALPILRCYPNQLNQVLMNLFSNALRAMGAAGTLTITTRADDASVRISVQDDGCGIAPGDFGRLFEASFTTTGASVSTGMGLAICASIVQKHGGTIEVDSELGLGAVFHVTLPLRGP